ncbi:MAG: D-alanyl-D-alanine carboxypeptidase family protein [Aminipila sp.]
MKKGVQKRLLAISITVALCFGSFVTVFAADMVSPLTVKINVDGNASSLKAYSSSYENNNFICLRDVAQALNGTDKQFNVTYDKEKKAVNLIKGKPYVPVGNEGAGGNRKVQWASSSVAKLYVDGNPVKYNVYNVDGNTYIKFADIMQMFDLNAQMKNKAIIVDSSKGYTVNMDTLGKNGYFNFLNGAIVGNASTGEIIFSDKEDNKVAIASTTKIMTYLLVKEAIDSKKVSLDDEVILSKNAEAESVSEDGVIPMKAGQTVKVSELLEGLLIVSSNECATALAEYVAGSEAKFVELMNKKANELGLTSAEFYNPHGLPAFTEDVFTAKCQNRMNAKDLFALARYVINKYPEVLETVSKTEVNLESLKFSALNTNRLLFNTSDVDGLKTGSTNRAGACLIATTEVKNGDKTERVISVILGAELTAECAEKSSVLLQYAKQFYEKN